MQIYKASQLIGTFSYCPTQQMGTQYEPRADRHIGIGSAATATAIHCVQDYNHATNGMGLIGTGELATFTTGYADRERGEPGGAP